MAYTAFDRVSLSLTNKVTIIDTTISYALFGPDKITIELYKVGIILPGQTKHASSTFRDTVEFVFRGDHMRLWI